MKRALVGFCLACAPGIASAADWTIEAGAALVNEPDHIGARSRRWLALPVLSATYGTRLEASVDDGARWTAFDLNGLKLGPVVEYRASYDRGLPAGFRKIRDAIEPGLFAEITTPVAIVEGRVRRAVTGYGGWSAGLAIDTLLPVHVPGTIGIEARAAWADRRFGRTRFEIEPTIAATTGLATYVARDYYTLGLGAQWRLPLTQRIVVTASLGADRLLTNGSSPIVRTRSMLESGLGLTYRFKS